MPSSLAVSTMAVNGLMASVNMPLAPKGEGEVHGLPPYARQFVYEVDSYSACPTNWMHGSAKASSYFMSVKPDHHLWFDFNANLEHSHHVAIVLSVQGINPITGQKTKDLRLVQYRENCPEHKTSFKQDRFCETCGYKWPAQNYMTTVSTPKGLLWIDGFRAEGGTIRGFLITKDLMKGVATQLIGEDRVWAVGIAFFLSKELKRYPDLSLNTLRFNKPLKSSGPVKQFLNPYPLGGADPGLINLNAGGKGSSAGTVSVNSLVPTSTNSGGMDGGLVDFDEFSRGISLRDYDPPLGTLEVEKLEIAAGSKIEQELAYFDPSQPSFYEDEPAGMIYLNYCTEEDLEKILAHGQRDTTKKGEGFLASLDKGNP